MWIVSGCNDRLPHRPRHGACTVPWVEYDPRPTGAIAGPSFQKHRAGAGLRGSVPARHPPRSAVSTPDLHLRTSFLLDGDGRIRETREPDPSPGPLFSLIRGRASRAWAVRADVPGDIADEFDRLARQEPPASDFRHAPGHAERYRSLVKGTVDSGPAYAFPEQIDQH